MKKKLTQFLAITCLFSMMISLTACKKTENKEPDTPSETQTVTEQTETPETEALSTTETETQTTTEVVTESTESEPQSETQTEVHDFQHDFPSTLETINDIRAGSAGCSLRAEEAYESFKAFVTAYGDGKSSEEVRKLTSEWLDAQKTDNPYIYDDFTENLYMLTSHIDLDSTNFPNSDACKNVINGIQASLE